MGQIDRDRLLAALLTFVLVYLSPRGRWSATARAEPADTDDQQMLSFGFRGLRHLGPCKSRRNTIDFTRESMSSQAPRPPVLSLVIVV